MERQMEDQCQKLHITEINLATEKKTILDLKAELQKTKDAARVAREVVKAAVNASYKRGVLDTETCLVEEVAILCRDYCTESWGVATDQVEVLADSKLRRVENIFFPDEIWEIPNTIPYPEQFPTSQAPSPDAKLSKGAGVGKEAQPPMKAKPSKDALIIRDVVF